MVFETEEKLGENNAVVVCSVVRANIHSDGICINSVKLAADAGAVLSEVFHLVIKTTIRCGPPGQNNEVGCG